jgi:hypothetical protein
VLLRPSAVLFSGLSFTGTGREFGEGQFSPLPSYGFQPGTLRSLRVRPGCTATLTEANGPQPLVLTEDVPDLLQYGFDNSAASLIVSCGPPPVNGVTGRRRLHDAASGGCGERGDVERRRPSSAQLNSLLHAEFRGQQGPKPQRRRTLLQQQVLGPAPPPLPPPQLGNTPPPPPPPPPILSQEQLSTVDSTGGSIYVVATTGLEFNRSAAGGWALDHI